MPSILNAASRRIQAVVEPATGPILHTPPAHPASATEVADLIPTEFGGLTHLFGGEATPVEFEPVNPALEIPGGSRPGALGGLVPDFRSIVGGGSTPAAGVAPSGPAKPITLPGGVALTSILRNRVTQIRQWVKI